ncbi:MAG: diguanylate cyclase, partial [Smithellaceae bacterium]|nr:diguanylate cyclase [Smithellaceae bacterium]
KIVLFDEPTSGQDPVRKNAILSMIAQYQRKFGFTAIMVSHEIPDVYFISNRILALYDRKIVFQGTPEELESFDHPFKDEVIRSLEGLQQELTGLHSRRQFKLLYGNQLKRWPMGQPFCVIVFTLEGIEAIQSGLGYDAAQEAIRCMGTYIDRHFGTVGGFSTRRRLDKFVTMLPNADIDEAKESLHDFIDNLQKQGIRGIMAGAQRRATSKDCVEFIIRAGIAQGEPTADMDAIIANADRKQEEIGRMIC